MRLFAAIELSDAAREHLAGLCDELRRRWGDASSGTHAGDQTPGASWPKASWVRPDNLHLTLKFFGEVAERDVPALTAALGRASAGPVGPMQLFVHGVQCFPPRGQVRVITVGIEGDTQLLGALHAAVERGCEQVGFKREGRAYRAHVTLARCRTPLHAAARQRLSDAAARHLPGPVFDVGRFVLMESRLKPAGAEYTPVAHFPLNRPAEAS